MSGGGRPVGVLLAGGQARRMGGSDKGLAILGGHPLLAHAIARLAPQVDGLVISANGDPARLSAFGLPVVADTIPGAAGPLAGILAGMAWTRLNRPAAMRIATVAADTPFFPDDLVARLAAAAGGDRITIARSGGRLHRVFGVFPVERADDLQAYLHAGGNRKVGDWLNSVGFVPVDFATPPSATLDAFFNINTPEDLATAEAALAAAPQLPAGRG